MLQSREVVNKFNKWLSLEGKIAFISAFIVGIITHMVALTSDIPNHDGLDSMYFSQNMIGSGRWFLAVTCGISSFYSVPWLIGVLAILYLSVVAVFLVKLLKIQNAFLICLVSVLVVTFPTLTSNFAYVFTMDGYMLGLLFAVIAVYLVDKHRFGFLYGGIALALSMGTYQAYLPVSILLSIFMVWRVLASDIEVKRKINVVLDYIYMGIIGAALYYVTLKILMAIEHVSFNTYQGIDSVGETSGNFIGKVIATYKDFAIYSLRGSLFYNNYFIMVASFLLFALAFWCFLRKAVAKKWFAHAAFYIIVLLSVMMIPVFTNVILIISPDVTYHALMRYQWVVFYICAIAFIEEYVAEYKYNFTYAIGVVTVVCAFVICFSYIVADNIAYSNLQKKYEKTYAYCLRLADRIEQTEGYYEGIPIYMIGVVGDDNFPVTDITGDVTGGMLGINGDYLLYTPKNYELFYKYYMGISFNFLSPDEVNYYDEEWYVDMPSFPYKDSVKVVNGVLVVKTENTNRD